MTIYTYSAAEHNVTSITVLTETLADNGVTDASITLNVSLTVDTAAGTQAQVDLAVSEATGGGLKSVKIEKIQEIQDYSRQLLGSGFSSTIGAKTGQFALDLHNGNYGYYEGLLAKYGRTPAIVPFQLVSMDGKVINVDTSAKINKLANNAYQRIEYICFDKTNGDGSKGEAGYIIDVRAATTVAAVNAITDTRV